MPWSFLLNPTVLLGIALALALGTVGIQTKRLDSAQAHVQAITADFNTYKARIASEGRAAQERADKQAKEDKQRQVEADNENKATIGKLTQRVSSMRYDADNSGRYRLPSNPADTKRPDLACFDRAEFSRAGGTVLGELREISDKGDAATIDLNTARQWAQSR